MPAPKFIRQSARLLCSAMLFAASLAASAAPTLSLTLLSPPTVPLAAIDPVFLRITISEPSGAGLTAGALTFTYPAGLVNESVSSYDCGGVLTAVPGTGLLSVAGGSISASFTFCTIDLLLRPTAAGSYGLAIPALAFVGTSGTNAAPSNTVSLLVTPAAVVSNTDDTGPGSLRAAIDYVNSVCLTTPTNITFAIPGTGPHTIQPSTELPPIGDCETVIDGYTQSSSRPNGDGGGSNDANIQVILNGDTCSTSGTCNAGLRITSGQVTIRGLAIRSFRSDAAIVVTGGNARISGNYLGTDPGGMNAFPNNAGVNVYAGSAVVGSGSPADANLITGNSGVGVLVNGGEAVVFHNVIGGKRDGSAGIGNFHGVMYAAALYDGTVGGNYIRYNRGAGVVVHPTNTSAVEIVRNRIFANDGIGIDLGENGATSNDNVFPYDDLGGPNARQNFPTLTSVRRVTGNTVVDGYLRSSANADFTVEFFNTTLARSQTEGEQFLDSISVRTDASGVAVFSHTIAGILADNVSATASRCGDGCDVTSEYSPSLAAGVSVTEVTTFLDSGPGSLRDVINYVNANCAAQTITFNIPGAGVQVIQPLSVLPAITCPGVTIDGYTQPFARPNALAVGNDAIVLIQLHGASAPHTGTEVGIRANARPFLLKGLSITGWDAYGVQLNAGGAGTMQVAGSFIGVDGFGTTGMRNGAWGIQVNTSDALVGGAAAGERNVVADGITVDAPLNEIMNNYIGTNAAGTAALGPAIGVRANSNNTWIHYNVISGTGNGFGILVKNFPGTFIENNLIGTDASGTVALPNGDGVRVEGTGITTIGGFNAGNVISGNRFSAIRFTDFNTGSHIQGNFIGTDRLGTANLGNLGLAIQGVYNRTNIGGELPGEGNVIAFNTGGAMSISGSGNAVRGNSIFLNGSTYGIDLGPGTGVLHPNDACDADTGANEWQNYPDLASAASSGGFTLVQGTATGIANHTFRLEFFSNLAADGASNKAGRKFLGSMNLLMMDSCATPFMINIPQAVPTGDTITATATDITVIGGVPANNTSAFSNEVVVAVAGPVLTLGATSLVIPALIGTNSTGTVVTLTNSGTAPINLVSFASSAGFVQGTLCNFQVLPGETCEITVFFTASAIGTRAGTLTITSDAPGSPHVVSLTGHGMAPPAFSLVGSSTVTPGQTSTMSIRIQNPAGNPAAYGNFTATHTYPAGFVNAAANASYPQGGCGATLSYTGGVAGGNTIGFAGGGSVAPSSTCSRATSQVVVPSTLGTHTFTIPAGGFTITSPFNYSNPAPITFNMTVTAPPAPGITLSSSSLIFGTHVIGSTSPAQTLTLGNNGTATLTIASITASGDYAFNGNCGTSLAVGSTCTLNVSFTPVASGPRAGAITITTNGAGSPHVVGLAGDAQAPIPSLTLTPASLVFATRALNTTSPTQTVTLGNEGNAPLAISSVTSSGDFAFASGCGASLAVGATCTIDVTFTPLAEGTRSGAIMIVTNAPGNPHAIVLSGVGQGAPTAVVELTPATLEFPAQGIGMPSAREVVMVNNVGNAVLVFGGFAASEGFVIEAEVAGTTFERCGASLNPGRVCALAVTFAPIRVGLHDGILRIDSNASNAPTLARLLGTGVVVTPARVLSVPALVSFGEVPVGTPGATTPVPIRNLSASAASITELVVGGDFRVSDSCTLVAGLGTCSPLVTFRPTAVGERSGTLTIRALNELAPYVVSLSGIGTFNPVPALTLSAARLGFGNTLIGVPSSESIVLTNVGQVPVAVDSVLSTGDFLVTNGCGATIAVGASCSIDVRFFPRLAGGHAGALEIRTNATGTPHRVELSGVGCALPSRARARTGALSCGP